MDRNLLKIANGVDDCKWRGPFKGAFVLTNCCGYMREKKIVFVVPANQLITLLRKLEK